MKQIPNYGDQRTLSFCAFCGGETGTKDHCPSKVFLDEPYPENLPVVPACLKCNSSFSPDEEYMACLLSCVLDGSTDPEDLSREKIKRILTEKPALRALIEQSRTEVDGRITHIPNLGRVAPVLLKLAKGHALYELHELCTRDPDVFEFGPLGLMTQEQRESFETPEISSCWPEVGSRAMQRLLVQGQDVLPSGWIQVQPKRYRYLASLGNGIEVRIVIDEYLACFSQWEFSE